MTTTLDSLLTDYLATSNAVQAEDKLCIEAKASTEYLAIQDRIDNLQQQQAALLSHIPDSTEEMTLDKEALCSHLEAESISDLPGYVIKTRKKRSVDTRAVLEAMQGDIDNLMLVSSVKMKDLETFAKANPEYKKDLRRCIVEDGFSVSDITPE